MFPVFVSYNFLPIEQLFNLRKSYCIGYEVASIDDVVEKAQIFVTATGCKGIIKSEHFMKMREDAIVCNIGHFDCEIDVAWLEQNCKKEEVKPQVW